MCNPRGKRSIMQREHGKAKRNIRRSTKRHSALLEQMLRDSNISNNLDILKHIAQQKREVEEIHDRSLQGIQLQSKVRWVEEGEKNTKYFMNLEKRNFERKIMNAVLTNDGKTITKPVDILWKQARF